MVLDFEYDADHIDRDVRDSFIFISQIKNTILHIHDVAAKSGIRSAGHVDLLAQKLF